MRPRRLSPITVRSFPAHQRCIAHAPRRSAHIQPRRCLRLRLISRPSLWTAMWSGSWRGCTMCTTPCPRAKPAADGACRHADPANPSGRLRPGGDGPRGHDLHPAQPCLRAMCPWRDPCAATHCRELRRNCQRRHRRKKVPTRKGIAYVARRADGAWLLGDAARQRTCWAGCSGFRRRIGTDDA